MPAALPLWWTARRNREWRCLIGRFLIDQNSLGGPVEIVELSRLKGPEKARQPKQPQKKGGGNQVDQHTHGRTHLSRSAFRVTSRDEDDMATAARSGVTMPATARGTAARL